MNDEYVKEISMERLEELKHDYLLRRSTEIGFILEMEILASEYKLESTLVTSKGHTLRFITDTRVKKNTAPTPYDEYTKPLTPLTAAMDNVLCHKLAEVALEAGDRHHKGVGDHIDRGLLLRQLLEEYGFYLVMKK